MEVGAGKGVGSFLGRGRKAQKAGGVWHPLCRFEVDDGGPSREKSGILLIGIVGDEVPNVTSVMVARLGITLLNGLSAPMRSRP